MLLTILIVAMQGAATGYQQEQGDTICIYKKNPKGNKTENRKRTPQL
jgi:hypothetical protein